MPEDGVGRCETDGCHRQATHVVTYTVYGGGEVREETRNSCEPCINAMRFRETFTWSEDEWSVTPITGMDSENGGENP